MTSFCVFVTLKGQKSNPWKGMEQLIQADLQSPIVTQHIY